MVVVDSSALIPLSWVGRLDILQQRFEQIRAPKSVRAEVLTNGKEGAAALESFLQKIALVDSPDDSARVASLEGIATTDAAVILLAENTNDRLLANDAGLIRVGQAHNVDCWWVTTLILSCRKEGILTPDEAQELLYTLVNEGMNLSPQIYAQVHDTLESLDT